MRPPKLIAIICSCALAYGGAAAATTAPATAAHATRAVAAASEPRAAGVVVAPGAETAVTADGDEPRNAPAPTAAAATPQTAGRKKENVLVRILAAPFRGLAHLFGGKPGRAKVARVKVVEPTRRESNAAQGPRRVEAATGQQSTQQIATVLPQPAPLPAPPPALLTGATPAPSILTERAAAAAPSVAPATPTAPAEGEDGEASYAPAPFIPLVVGVPGDPLSQGRALLERGYVSEAISELSVAAVTGQSLVEANNLLGLAYDRRGRHAQAREAFERALSAAPADPHILNNLGYSLYLGDHYKEALARLKQAARLAPGNPHILNNLALVYGRLQKFGDAFKHFERAGGELHARMQTGAMLEAAGRDREAIRHYEAARRIDETSTEPLRRLIPLYNRTGQRDKVEAVRRDLDRPATKAAASSSG